MTLTQSQLNQVIESGSFTGLIAMRYDHACHLVIESDGTRHVYSGKSGKPKSYRHVHQITQWLSEKFGIDPSQIIYECHTTPS